MTTSDRERGQAARPETPADANANAGVAKQTPQVEVSVWAHLKWALLALLAALVVWSIAPLVLELLGIDELKPAR